MKVVAIIQARMGSSRLPGKVLMPLGGVAVLRHVVERARRATLIDEVIIATSATKADLEIVDFAGKHNYKVVTGSESDVLSRFNDVAIAFPADHYVRLTADCPLISPALLDELVELHLSGAYDYCYAGAETGYPRGYDSEVFTAKILSWLHTNCEHPLCREHVTIYINDHRNQFRRGTLTLPAGENLSEYRLTLDTKEDYQLLSAIFDNLYGPNSKYFEIGEVITFLKQHPDIAKINKRIVQKSHPKTPRLER